MIMNKDSNYLADLIFGSEIVYLTDQEKKYLLNLFENRKAITCTAETLKLKTSDVQILLHDSPDLLLIIDNTVIAIEHFKIDASKTTKKGSTYKQKYTEQYFKDSDKKALENFIKNKSTITSEEITTDLEYNNLYENLITCLNAHYKKLNHYEKNIKNIELIKKYKIEHIFFVEYDIISPSFFRNKKGSQQSFLPHNDVNFISFLKNKLLLSGLIFYYKSNSNFPNVNQFIFTSSENLENYIEENGFVHDPTKIEVFDFSNLKTITITV